MFTGQRKTFNLLRIQYVHYPSPDYLVPFVGGKFSFLPLPFSIFASAANLIIYKLTAVYPNSFYPVTGLLMRRIAVACCPNTHYQLATLVPVHNFLCTCTMLILIAQNDMFYSTLTHRASVLIVVGKFFFQFLASLPWQLLPDIEHIYVREKFKSC